MHTESIVRLYRHRNGLPEAEGLRANLVVPRYRLLELSHKSSKYCEIVSGEFAGDSQLCADSSNYPENCRYKKKPCDDRDNWPMVIRSINVPSSGNEHVFDETDDIPDSNRK